jgi:hypothetical protein
MRTTTAAAGRGLAAGRRLMRPLLLALAVPVASVLRDSRERDGQLAP